MIHQKDRVLDHVTILNRTKDIHKLNVTLKATKKGVSVFSTKPIYKGEIVLYYKLKVYSAKNFKSKTKNKYSCTLYSKRGEEITHLIGDIYPNSVPDPLNGIPFWGHFANEPNPDEKVNTELFTNTKYNYQYSNRCKLTPGDTVIYELRAIRYIPPGSEILWNYGPNYERNYEVSKL